MVLQKKCRSRRRLWPRALAAVGMVAGLVGVKAQPVHAHPDSHQTAEIESKAPRFWAQKLHLDIEGDTVRELLFQIRQQLMVHIRPGSELEREPLSVFAEECTLGDLRDALSDGIFVSLTAKANFESFLLFLGEDRRARLAVLTQERAAVKKAASLKGKPSPAAATSAPDAELTKRLSIPPDMSPIPDGMPPLPAIQRKLAKAAEIRIFSDYTPRTDRCLGRQSADAFFRSLDGMPLQTVLDKIAGKFGYTWHKSRGWILFRSKHWQAEREARMAASDGMGADPGSRVILGR
jgi:hypothetical protein